jgi:predicted nucleic acid-binding protein
LRRILLDVNVVLDVLLDRRPHAEPAARLWVVAENRGVHALVPAHGFSTVFYLARRQRGAAFARRAVADLLSVFGVAPVDDVVLRRALALEWSDFEDAICAAAAEASRCTLHVSRDPSGFRGSPVPVVDPPTGLALVDPRLSDTVSEPRATRRRGAPRVRARA